MGRLLVFCAFAGAALVVAAAASAGSALAFGTEPETPAEVLYLRSQVASLEAALYVAEGQVASLEAALYVAEGQACPNLGVQRQVPPPSGKAVRR